MGFIEYYKAHRKHGNKMFWTEGELPEEVKADLWELLEKNDKRIGFYVYDSYVWDAEHSRMKLDGMKVAYYVRSWHPHIITNDFNIPCGIRFWNMRRVSGG